MIRFVFVMMTVAFAQVSIALELGDKLPELIINNKGQLIVDAQRKLSYKSWDSKDLDTRGSVQIIQYLAARPSSDEDGRLFTGALRTSGLDPKLYHLTTVINSGDVPFGMSSLAETEFSKQVFLYPSESWVVDRAGHGREVLGLQPRSMNVLILDGCGKLLFLNKARLTEADVTQVMSILRKEVKRSSE